MASGSVSSPSSTQVGGGKKPKKGGVKGDISTECPRVSESTRIHISNILENFLSSNDNEYTFQENMNNYERAAVHVLSRRMGMKSKSSGIGTQRRISVFKKKNMGSGEVKEKLVSFRFSEESKTVLQDLFSHYPPDDAEMTQNKVKESSGKCKTGAAGDDMFCTTGMTVSEIANKVEALASKVEKDPKLKQITNQRSKLPIASFKDVITSTVDSNQVVLICGETGCGKTTQVPQYILDHAWSKGDACKIVCTQPRRISATSVSERIAAERGEIIGDTVGYKIRMESSGGRQSSLVFCTNGVLLRILVSKQSGKTKKKTKLKQTGLSELTHIIVDEIHERDRFSDFMLAILRDMLPSYPHLRLILMSATIDAERFSKYFGDCPLIKVPGFTYPVKTFYLEDVLSLVGTTENHHLTGVENTVMGDDSALTEECSVALDEAIDLALSNDDFDPLLEFLSSEADQKVFNYKHSKTGVTPLMVFAEKGRVGDICMLLSFGVDCHLQSNERKTALDYAERKNQKEAAEIIKRNMDKAFTYSDQEKKIVDKYLSNVDPELIDRVLIEKLLRKICTESEAGAILVFLPGWDDINKTREKLQASPFFKNMSKFLIISLHSMVPSNEQKKVFQRAPPGCRKIVLSTNIAETSVTIDDVVYVLDSGRMKEKSYDPYSNVSTLQSSWVSKASAKQREGRAGRCQPGICYHLYTKIRAVSLPDFQVPEIKRMPIEELCLQVKLMDPSCKIEEFLQKTLDPPVQETIRNAIIVLQNIGALTLEEKLTDLGEKIGSLPVHPLTSKMLFFAILLNCLDPALTLACASDYKDPFIIPMLPNERGKAQAARAELASFYGGNGDQLAVIAAFDCWQMAKAKGEEARFCSLYFISSGTMRMISGMRKKLEGELLRSGFIPQTASSCSLNARDPGILHAVVLAGLYPMVGRVLPQGNRRLVETADGNKVSVHSRSTNAKLSFKKSSMPPLIVFDEITRGDGGLYIRNCTFIGSLSLLLLAADIVVAPSKNDGDDDNGSDDKDAEGGTDCDEDEKEGFDLSDKKIMSSPENSVSVVVDRWIPFESTALDVAQIYCLRERLSAAILYKVTHPQDVLPEHLGASLYAIACILSYDWLSGMPFESDNPNQVKKTGTNLPQRNDFLKSLVLHNSSRHNYGSNYQHQNHESGSAVVNGRPSVINRTTVSRGKFSKRPRGKMY